MTRIVREHYPVEKLPEDLRPSLDDTTHARVVVESEAGPAPAPGEGHFSRWRHLRRTRFRDAEEIVAHIRALRDEWDRR